MIKVAIIEDHKEYRESIYYILQSTEGYSCVGKYESVEDALMELKEPEVILLDIKLPGMSGIEGIKKLKSKFSNVRIIMLTVFEDDINILQSIISGADGYLLKKSSPITLLNGIKDVYNGGSVLTPSVAKQIMTLFKNYIPQSDKEIENLSSREVQILSMIVDGLNNNEIAEKLFISIETVRNHIRHIYEKLNVHSKSQAVVMAIKQRLV